MSNKTALVFLGPQHHFQVLSPITEELKKRGWTIRYYTANAEASFEVGLNRTLGEDYDFLPLWQDREASREIYQRGLAYLRGVMAEPNPVTLEPPPVLDRILTDIACDATATPHLLRHVKPDVCLALHEINRWGMLLGYWCAELGIPFLTFQEGLYYGQTWIYTGHTRYSTSLVWGDATKRLLLTAGCPDDRVEVIGHPDLRLRADAAREMVLHQQPFVDKKILFLFITSVTIGHLPMDKLTEGLAQSQWRVVVKMHHLASLPNIKKIKDFLAPYPDTCYLEEDYEQLWPWLVRADLVGIMGCSTLGLEALYCEKPLMEFYAPGQPMSFAEAKLAHQYVEVENGQPLPRLLLTNIERALALWQQPAHQERVKAWVQDQIAHPAAARWIADRIEKAAIQKNRRTV